MTFIPTVGVCCIGSGVGQSVIRSLNLSRLRLRTVGIGSNPFAFGAYECDTRVYTRGIYEKEYVDDLIGVCRSQGVDLLIPALDDELALLARHRGIFEAAGVMVLVSDEPLVALCRDKNRMRQDLATVSDIFVRSYEPRTLQQEAESGRVRFPLIAKPRGGFASRGVRIVTGISDVGKISHDDVVQELAIPPRSDPNYEEYAERLSQGANAQVSEISIQLVCDQRGGLLGRMASYNRLQNGIPVEVLPYENPQVWQAVDRLFPLLVGLGLRGPFNLQGRLSDEGLKIFEMNPRFTGITGLRALLGFNEVEACVKAWLDIDSAPKALRVGLGKFGVRQVTDKAVLATREPRVASLRDRLGQGALSTKRLLVTGASGYVGRNWVRRLAETGRYEILAFSRVKSKLARIFDHPAVVPIGDDDIRSGGVPMGEVDAVVHLGSALAHSEPADFASSLRLTAELFAWAASHQVPMILNVSSQSVYGRRTEPPWGETTIPQPDSLYGQLKLASELLLETACRPHPHIGFSSIRLGTVTGGADGMLGIDVIAKMVRQAMADQDLQVFNADQQLQRIDISDVLDGLTVLLERPPQDLRPVYNVGCEAIIRLVDVAGLVADLVAKEVGRPAVSVRVTGSSPDVVPVGLDSTLMFRDTGWKASRSIDESIRSLIRHYSESGPSPDSNGP